MSRSVVLPPVTALEASDLQANPTTPSRRRRPISDTEAAATGLPGKRSGRSNLIELVRRGPQVVSVPPAEPIVPMSTPESPAAKLAAKPEMPAGQRLAVARGISRPA